MKVLAVHNSYQHAGGEDVVFESETALLESRGIDVLRYLATNTTIDGANRLALAARAVWNPRTYANIRRLLAAHQPDVVHVHNTVALVSPSVYAAARDSGMPVVQTLHNFRLICPGALLRREHGVCEQCLGTSTFWPAVVHACYRGSRAATATVATTIATHALLGTWRRIDRYIALSAFARDKFIQAGWPAEKFVVQPNFAAVDPGLRPHVGGDYLLYLGRLSPEKGLSTLLRAYREIPDAPVLKIAGDGPLRSESAAAHPRIEWLGQQTRAEVVELLRNAALLIVPSESYETSPLAIIEAFAVGTPVITSRLGAMAEMVEDGVTGRLFTAGDPHDLAATVGWALQQPAAMTAMAAQARRAFDSRYTADRHFSALIDIYLEVIREQTARAVDRPGNDHGSSAPRSERTVSAGAGPPAG
jgi:glycosyltransferase involved in cell wall biosynthesis